MNDISSGNYKVISTGSVMSFEEESIRIQFGDHTDPLFIKFSFHEAKESDGKYKVELSNVNEKELELKLFNFDNPLGIGNTAPISIGSNNSKKIFLNYRIYSLGGVKSKLVHHTIYQEI